MNERVLLCADEQSLAHPVLIGLEDELLEKSPWLACESDAHSCRQAAKRCDEMREVWVISCVDMEPINVAAAVKQDNPTKSVYLVSADHNGSLASRVANAGIDGLWTERTFVENYTRAKARYARAASAAERMPLAPPIEMQGCEPERRVPERNCQTAAGAQEECTLHDMTHGWAPIAPVAQQEECAPTSPTNLSTSAKAKVPETSEQPEVQRAYRAKGAPAKEGLGTVISVVSGSGGCGKSAISAVFALVAARAGLRIAVVDADLQFGDLDYLLGVQEPVRIEDVKDDPDRLASMTEVALAGTPMLIAAPRRLEVSELVAGEVAPIIRALRETFDIVVVNTGSLWADGHAGVLEIADSVAFVMDSRPSSLRATVHAVELCARLGIATTGFTFVVNRHERTSLLSAVDVSCALRGARAVELPHGGRDVDELLGAGYPEELIGSKNAFIEAARDLLSELAPPKRAEAIKDKKVLAKKKRPLFGRGGAQ